MNKLILFMLVVVFSFLLPIGLFIIWRKKTNCKWIAFLVGVISFTVFANGLEPIVHYFCLSKFTAVSALIYSSPIAYALYGGLMAGLFEETGRLFSYKIWLNRYDTKEISVGYGIGHAGVECILTLGITYLLYVIVLAGGSLGDSATNLSIIQTIDMIDTSLVPIAMLERIIAMCTHVGLSILVFKAVRYQGSFYLYIVAILLHLITDIPAALYQFGMIQSIILVEVITMIIALIILFFGIRTYKTLEK